MSSAEIGRHSATSAIPALPGAAHIFSARGEPAIFHARACSRPPPPTIRTFNEGFSAQTGALRLQRHHETRLGDGIVIFLETEKRRPIEPKESGRRVFEGQLVGRK